MIGSDNALQPRGTGSGDSRLIKFTLRNLISSIDYGLIKFNTLGPLDAYISELTHQNFAYRWQAIPWTSAVFSSIRPLGMNQLHNEILFKEFDGSICLKTLPAQDRTFSSFLSVTVKICPSWKELMRTGELSSLPVGWSLWHWGAGAYDVMGILPAITGLAWQIPQLAKPAAPLSSSARLTHSPNLPALSKHH